MSSQDPLTEISVEEWKERVLELCNRGGVSMSEVNDLPNAEGDDSIWLAERENVVLWCNLQKNLTKAICELLASREIEACSTSVLIYLFDGRSLKMPLAIPGKRGYKTPRWLPVALNLPKKKQSPKAVSARE
jgi:hypothetical protein